MANTPLNRYASCDDATPGSALATPAFNILPWASGTQIQLKSSSVVSPVFMPNGASAGQTNVSYWVEGSVTGQLMRDPTIDRALSSLLMNSFTSKVLKPGTTEKPVCYEKMFVEGATSYYRQARGCQHTKMEIKWDADSIVDYTTDWIGQSDSRVTTMVTGATYTNPSTSLKLGGNNVVVSLGGSLVATQLKKGSVSIELARKTQTVCGSVSPIGMGFGGARSVSFSLSFYKRDFTFDNALIGNTPISVGVAFGGANTGYSFTSASVVFDAPQDEDDESGMLVTVTGKAGWDATAATDLTVTQL